MNRQQDHFIDDCQCCDNKGYILFVPDEREIDAYLNQYETYWYFCPLNCISRLLFETSFKNSKNPFKETKIQRVCHILERELAKILKTFLSASDDGNISELSQKINDVTIARELNSKFQLLMNDSCV